MLQHRGSRPKKPTQQARWTRRIALDWCSTIDAAEDWFVVAASAASARRYHADEEGNERGDAFAEYVVPLPPELIDATGCRDPDDGLVSPVAARPSDELRRVCGGAIAPLPTDPLRVAMGVVTKAVRFGGRDFHAGDLLGALAAEERIAGHPRLALFRRGASEG